MGYPKEWDQNTAYELHIEAYKRTHPEEFGSPSAEDLDAVAAEQTVAEATSTTAE